MPRPKFPTPYMPLPAACIRRIISDQAHYDRDPEAAEHQQAAREEQRRMEEEQEWLEYERQREEAAQPRVVLTGLPPGAKHGA